MVFNSDPPRCNLANEINRDADVKDKPVGRHMCRSGVRLGDKDAVGLGGLEGLEAWRLGTMLWRVQISRPPSLQASRPPNLQASKP